MKASSNSKRTELATTTTSMTPSIHGKLSTLTSQNNAMTISNYLVALESEINPSKNYKQDIVDVLCYLSIRSNNKDFKQMKRQEDILAFLNGLSKSESEDPLHKWIGTYNTYRIYLCRFFKWLYNPDLEPDKRPNPAVIENIPQIKRKEMSINRPTDLWTAEDDALFLRYCPTPGLDVITLWLLILQRDHTSY